MEKECAYCGSSTKLTKEHVLPASLMRRVSGLLPLINIRDSQGNEKIIKNSAATIADVCSDCNNGPLSELDSYLVFLFDFKLSQFVTSGERVVLDYDFNQLSRWILKCGYNMGRSRKWKDLEVFRECIPYILTGSNRPKSFALLVQLIIPSKLPPGDKFEDGTDIWPPEHIGMHRQWTFEGAPRLTLWVPILSFQFYLIFDKDERILSRALSIQRRQNYGTYLLSPSKSRQVLYPSSIDARTHFRRMVNPRQRSALTEYVQTNNHRH